MVGAGEGYVIFTGHEYDMDTNLNYFGARYQDGSRGQFISQDPSSRDNPEAFLGDPQQLNYYSYARNNPIVITDPNGKWIEYVVGEGNAVSMGNWATNNSVARYATDHPVQGIAGATIVGSAVVAGGIVAGPSIVAAAPELASISASRAIAGTAGGLAAQYVGDVASNVVNGQSGLGVLAPRSSASQYAISGVSVGATSVFAPNAAPLTIGGIAAGTSFVQDRAGRVPITAGGIANNVVSGLGALATEGLMRQTPGVPGRLPNANTTADFIGAHAISNYTKQAVSAASQYVSSFVGSLINKIIK